MELGLTGRRAVVSGASAGLGRAIAAMLSAEGTSVLAVARRRDLLDDLAAEASRSGGAPVIPCALDITESGAAQRIHDEAVEHLGGIDILVNNAGGSTPTAPGAEEQVWYDALELNFHAHRRLTELVLPEMRAAGWGRVINVTGGTEPRDVNAASPGKAAIHAWSKAISNLVAADGVTVNCVPPGRIHSEQVDTRLNPTRESQEAFARANIPMGRLGEADEFAAVVVFLASDRATYVTGQLIHVDGGMRRFAF